MAYYQQQSSYPGGPQASSYPGGSGFPTPSPYGSSVGSSNSASSYYDTHPIAPAGGNVRYDERGNVITQDGERGLGTMALGAMGGMAANKMSGSHQSKLKSGASGALLAQGAKMAYEMFNKKSHHGPPGHHGGHHGPGKGPAGFGSMFGKH